MFRVGSKCIESNFLIVAFIEVATSWQHPLLFQKLVLLKNLVCSCWTAQETVILYIERENPNLNFLWHSILFVNSCDVCCLFAYCVLVWLEVVFPTNRVEKTCAKLLSKIVCSYRPAIGRRERLLNLNFVRSSTVAWRFCFRRVMSRHVFSRAQNLSDLLSGVRIQTNSNFETSS